MRFMVMHKMTAELERGLPPDAETLAGINRLMEEAVQQKLFLSGEGLKPSNTRIHVAYKDGKRTVTDGPFAEAKELIAGFALLRVQSMDEAVEWMDKVVELSGDADFILGPVCEAWDLGFEPKPEHAPLRVLSLRMADERTEKPTPANPERMQQLGALVTSMKQAGVLQATASLTPTAKGARIHFAGGKASVTDGPFAESKELVAGYALIDVASKAEAVTWGIRFGEVVKVDEVEVREVA